MDKPASGNKITLEAFVIDKIKDGKIIEPHMLADFTAFMMAYLPSRLNFMLSQNHGALAELNKVPGRW